MNTWALKVASALTLLGGLGWGPATLLAQTGAVVCVQSLSLEQAYDRALASDQNILIAGREIQKADLLPWQALTKITPRLTASTSYFKPEDTINSPIGRINGESRSADLALEWPILDWAVFPAYHAGQLGKESARLQHRFVTRSVLFGVLTAFHNILKTLQVVKIHRETLDLARQQLDLDRKRFDFRQVTKSDVLRAQVVAERAERALADSQGRLRVAQTQLAVILNEPPQTVYTLVPPAEHPATTNAYETLLPRALEAREDYRVTQLTVQQARSGRGEVKAGYAPRLVLQAKKEWAHPDSLIGANDQWQATASVVLPLFEGGLREVNLQRSEQVIEQAKLQRDDLARQIEVEVKAAWVRVQTLAQTLQTVRAEVAAAAENYRNLQSQYNAGTATSLEVADALRDLNNAQTELAVQTDDYQVALHDLDRVTGTFQQERVQTTH